MFAEYTGGSIYSVKCEGIEKFLLDFASTIPVVLASRFSFTTSIFDESHCLTLFLDIYLEV